MEVTFENINEFIKNYPNRNLDCEHSFPKDFENIGNLVDNTFGYLSYLAFKTNNKNEIFIGSYPYNGSKVWTCTKCNRLTLSTTNDSGWGQLGELKIEFEKEFVIEPANKSVSFKSDRVMAFVQKFGFETLLNPTLIGEDYSGVKIIDKIKKYVFGYRLTKRNEQEIVNFEIIAQRSLLREIAKFEKEQ